MLGVMMFLSFLVPLIGALAIRRYAWICIWASLSTLVAVPVLLKLYNHTYDPMGWGFVFVLFFLPAAVGSAIGMAVTALRRWRQGLGDLTALNLILAVALAVITLSVGLMMAGDA